MSNDHQSNNERRDSERQPITPIAPIDRASNCTPNEHVANCKANNSQDAVDDALIKWTAALVFWTAAIFGVACISAVIAYYQWRAIDGQLTELKAQREADHRPWVTIKSISVRKNMTVDSSSPIFKLSYDLVNVGHTPAQVSISAKIILERNTKDNIQEWTKGQNDICIPVYNAKSVKWEGAPWAVIPGDIYVFPFFNEAKPDSIIGFTEYYPRLVGCILYRGTLDITNTVHKTYFWAWISKEHGKRRRDRGDPGIFTIKDGIIPESQIFINGLAIAGEAD